MRFSHCTLRSLFAESISDILSPLKLCSHFSHTLHSVSECFGHSFSSGTLSRFSHTLCPHSAKSVLDTVFPLELCHAFLTHFRSVWECSRHSFSSATNSSFSHTLHSLRHTLSFGTPSRFFSHFTSSLVSWLFQTILLLWNSVKLSSHFALFSESVLDTLSLFSLSRSSHTPTLQHSNTPTTTVHALKLKLLIEALYCNKHFLPLALKQGLFHYLSLRLYFSNHAIFISQM